jgi:hypothetical protein
MLCPITLEVAVAPELVEMATAEEVVPVSFEIFRAAPVSLAMCRFAVTDQRIENPGFPEVGLCLVPLDEVQAERLLCVCDIFLSRCIVIVRSLSRAVRSIYMAASPTR